MPSLLAVLFWSDHWFEKSGSLGVTLDTDEV